MDFIYKKMFIDNSYRNKENIIKTIEENKELMTNNLINNTNKTFSYVAFSLEEICQHLKDSKSIDSETIQKIKIEYEFNLLKNDYEVLSNKLK